MSRIAIQTWPEGELSEYKEVFYGSRCSHQNRYGIRRSVGQVRVLRLIGIPCGYLDGLMSAHSGKGTRTSQTGDHLQVRERVGTDPKKAVKE